MQFLEDLISAVLQTLAHRGRLRGWKPEHMGDGARGVKLLAEQLSSEIKVSGKGFALAERGRQFQVYV